MSCLMYKNLGNFPQFSSWIKLKFMPCVLDIVEWGETSEKIFKHIEQSSIDHEHVEI